MISPDDWRGLLLRLLFALLSGGLLGLERELRAKAGGLRTHLLVSLGATVFVLVPLQVSYPQSDADALSRAIQGIATGIGFVGAGEIVHQTARTMNQEGGLKVKGLTSAAAIWLTAALGIAAGCGLFLLCFLGTLIGLLILNGAKRLEHQLPHKQD